ncbi:hypothetical protein PHYPO_G00228020 [Pangasianodon hypophthalmus]|uniref:Aminopeptidase N-like N-terminal domain-containing protein n=1 Tax=Pangasianodon hypophthalmus TaxID=310915 RepID=A0A5N5NYA6_PANHP|nr:hypothetical protein PHYPO_G00228020 [Pangasianodon hypophthalmus]
MAKCHFSAMCIICTVVSIVSVSILVGLWTYQFLSFADQTRSRTEAPDSRCLPECPLPVSYDVTLWPRLKPTNEGLYIFTGNSTVVFKCVKETDLILIHANKLNLTADATLSALNGSPAPSITSTQTISKTQYLVFHLSEKLKAGEWYKLHTEFVGELADDLRGFYRSEYEVNGVKQIVATSQIRLTHTCGIFPCFDEPKTKPVFHITLLQERGTVTSSNAEEIEKLNTSVDGTDVTMSRFEWTGMMSSDQLTLIITDGTNVQPTKTKRKRKFTPM